MYTECDYRKKKVREREKSREKNNLMTTVQSDSDTYMGKGQSKR